MRSLRLRRVTVSPGRPSLAWPTVIAGHLTWPPAPPPATSAPPAPSTPSAPPAPVISCWACCCSCSPSARPPPGPPRTSPWPRLSRSELGEAVGAVGATPGDSGWRTRTPWRKPSGEDPLGLLSLFLTDQICSLFQSFQQSSHQVPDERPTLPPTPPTLPEETRF